MRSGTALGVLGLLAIASADPKSGIDVRSIDRSVRPQDDLYAFVNGGWLRTSEIPPDRVSYGTFVELADRADRDVREIVEEIASRRSRKPGSPEQQIADLYASLMDEARIEALGIAPIQPGLDRIAAIRTASDFAAEAGHLSAIGAGGPFPASLEIDAADATTPVARVGQGGTMLPDRDYYLKPDEGSAAIRAQYEAYLARVFALVGIADPARRATDVLSLETQLARAQSTQVEGRAAAFAGSRYTFARLVAEHPGFEWKAWARPQGLDRAVVILSQPDFFRTFASLASTESLETWKAWLAARYVTAAAPFLASPFERARFDFFGTVLSGQELPRTRWKRGVSLVNGYLGDAVGRIYAEKRFPQAAKKRMEQIVSRLRDAFRRSIKGLDWMSGAAKDEAAFKVSRMRARIGAPDAWRSYRGLVVKRDDLVGNIERAKKRENDDQMARLARPDAVDEWLMPPQTVNAYYSPARNEIVFPAGVLQPPLFDVEADDAVNYGAIGAVIGHEICHALDERGRLLDAAGAPRNWWNAGDQREYEKRARALIDQFSAFRAVDGGNVNGELTLRENVADLGGLEVAFLAYRMSLGGRPAPVIDGLTGDQRFFLGWARVWRSKTRGEYQKQSLLWNPYAPGEFRAIGPVSNFAPFYEAFGVALGDRSFRDPATRVRIWSTAQAR